MDVVSSASVLLSGATEVSLSSTDGVVVSIWSSLPESVVVMNCTTVSIIDKVVVSSSGSSLDTSGILVVTSNSSVSDAFSVENS